MNVVLWTAILKKKWVTHFKPTKQFRVILQKLELHMAYGMQKILRCFFAGVADTIWENYVKGSNQIMFQKVDDTQC